MIYLGYFNFRESSDYCEDILSVLELFSETPPIKTIRKPLYFSCGKLSSKLDLDAVLQSDDSILIGRAFEKDNNRMLKNDSFKALSLLSQEEFLETIWGKYIYIKVNQETSECEITLDSTGQLPLFYYVFENGNILFSSHIDIIFKVIKKKPQYNWGFLFSYIIYGNSSSCEAAFQNIFEIPPGCSLKLANNKAELSISWSPFYKHNLRQVQTRDTVKVLQGVLRPWVEPYETISVSLSGGLDSSSILYCLKEVINQDQVLQAFNYFHPSVQSSNELSHARKVCDSTGVKLIEIDISDCLPFSPFKWRQPLKPNKPYSCMNSLLWHEKVQNYHDFSDPIAFVDGQGSDHIFLCPPPKNVLFDYIVEKGIIGAKGELESITQFYRDSLFSVLKVNFSCLFYYIMKRRQGKRSFHKSIPNLPDWMKAEVVRDRLINNFLHPIYDNLPSTILPGKYTQIDAIYDGLSSIHFEMLNPCDPTFSPFLYKPVVESALSFSTYETFRHGYDRYPLRKSISDNFGADIAWRRDKGQTTGLFHLGVKQNIDFILDLCLEGHFAKQGIINKTLLQNAVKLIANGEIKGLWPLNYLVSAELFLRYWDVRS